MTKYMAQKEYDRMLNTVLDEETGMTEMDLYEWLHPYDDIVVVPEKETPNKYQKLMRLTYPIGDYLLEEEFTTEEFNELLNAYGNLQKKIEELAKEAEQ